MKKLVAALCMAAMSVSVLAGCGGSSSTSSAADTSAAESEVTTASSASQAAGDAAETLAGESAASTVEGSYKIGIVQMIENGAFNDMREGFIQELSDKGYSEDAGNLTIDYQCAQGDATNLQTIVQNMADGDYNLVATIATPATQAMVNVGSDIPIVFIAVSDPVAAGVLTSLDKPDKGATGTSNAIPVSDIFSLAEELTPDAKTYGVVYCTSEVNSVSTASDVKDYCENNGLTYKEATVTNSSEVQQAVQSLVGEVDAFFIPNDSVVMDSFSVITEISRENKIPVYGSSATMVDSGAFATVAISDTGIGATSADMAVQILEGTDVADIPAQVIPASETVINNQTLEALGIELPDDIKNSAIFVDDAQ